MQRNQLINKGIHFWAKISHKESTPIWEESIPNGYQQILKLRVGKSFSDYLFIRSSHPVGLIKSFSLYKKIAINLIVPMTTSVWGRTANTRSISHTTHATSKTYSLTSLNHLKVSSFIFIYIFDMLNCLSFNLPSFISISKLNFNVTFFIKRNCQ